MGAPESRFDTLFGQPWPLESWPEIPTHFIQARDDRFLPLDSERRVLGGLEETAVVRVAQLDIRRGKVLLQVLER